MILNREVTRTRSGTSGLRARGSRCRTPWAPRRPREGARRSSCSQSTAAAYRSTTSRRATRATRGTRATRASAAWRPPSRRARTGWSATAPAPGCGASRAGRAPGRPGRAPGRPAAGARAGTAAPGGRRAPRTRPPAPPLASAPTRLRFSVEMSNVVTYTGRSLNVAALPLRPELSI